MCPEKQKTEACHGLSKLLTLGGQCYLPPKEFVCPERDSNPHSHFWPKDFKSFVSTIPPSGLTDFAVQK